MKSSLFPSLVHLILVGGTVILTFAALWTPFCAFLSGENTCTSTLLQIVHRLFPFSRGIFEDKVANIWYCLSVPFEFRHLVSTDHLVRASLGLTLLLLFPICVDLLRRPLTPSRALLALVNCSLSFFLASFQVHEKSLLLALVPASFLIPQSPLDAGWFQIVGGMTLYPLLKRDGQAVPYFCTLVFYCSLLFGIFDKHIGTLSTQVTKAHNKSSRKHWFELLQPFITYIRHMYFLVSVTGFFLLHFAELQISPPERYPDLYPALFSIFGCCNLLWYYTYFVSWQLSLKEKSE